MAQVELQYQQDTAESTPVVRRRVRSGVRWQRVVAETLAYLFLIVAGVIMLLPLFWMIVGGFKAEWEMFIRHVVEDAPFPHGLIEGAKGVQLVECAHQSWKERRWVDVPKLEV